MRRLRRTDLRRTVLALALVSLGGAGYAIAAVGSVTLTAAGPQPATVTVNWGDTVLFSNGDGEPHGVSIPRATVGSPPIAPGANWAHVFDDRSGSYIFRQTGTRNFAGTVVVQLTGQVTIARTPATVTYGNRVAFRGTALPGFPVKLEQLTFGETGSWTERTTVQAGADGAWSASFAPEIGARYRASAAADQLRSPLVSVGVRPRISLLVARRVRAGRTVGVRARIAPAAAAVVVDLERYDAARRRWLRVGRGRPTAAGAVTFRWRAERGRTLLRVQLLRTSVHRGFEPVKGAAVVVVGS
jgi:plastocyanin